MKEIQVTQDSTTKFKLRSSNPKIHEPNTMCGDKTTLKILKYKSALIKMVKDVTIWSHVWSRGARDKCPPQKMSMSIK
jgi:hypothetical protein